LFNTAKVVEIFSDEWDAMIDVPLLPLTTSYMPANLEIDYRQMNPSVIEEEIKRKYMLELTIQRRTQNFQIVSQEGSIILDTKSTITMSLCDLYYQIKNRKCNLYTPKSDVIKLLDKTFELNYLFFDPTVE